MRMYDLIKKKRDGGTLTENELRYIINDYTNGSIPDYQMAAFLMAGYFKGFSDDETLFLTKAMAESGDILDLSAINGITADKHSTGGVGDKTSLVVCPIAASCGIAVAKMSGRGLGHTGGTIDKLESIPGFSVCLSEEAFFKQVNDIHMAIISPDKSLDPADHKIYSLRDVTATVDNISLVASSIMSKKIASGAKCIVLDVKTGSGAFMKSEEDAILLAKEMVKIGKMVGRKMAAVITDMNQPLGCKIGNSCEVIEAIDTLKGRGPDDLNEVSVHVAAEMLLLTGKASNETEAFALVHDAIQSGRALESFRDFVTAQGGNPNIIDDYSLLPGAKYALEVKLPGEGFVVSLNAEEAGTAAMMIGCGRRTKDDAVDHGAGILLLKKYGDYCNSSDTAAILYANDKSLLNDAADTLRRAYKLSSVKPTICHMIKKVIQ